MSEFFYFNYFIYFWLCWGFVAARAFSLVAVSRGYSLVAVCRLLTAVASLMEHGFEHPQASVVAAPGLWSTGSKVVVHGLSYSVACGIF